MIVTNYTCDKCTAVKTSPEGMYNVCVAVRKVTGATYNATMKPCALWCRVCVVAAGLDAPKDKEKAPAEPTTLEDLVRDIAQEEIDAAA